MGRSLSLTPKRCVELLITIHAPAESARQTERMPITSVTGWTSESYAAIFIAFL